MVGVVRYIRIIIVFLISFYFLFVLINNCLFVEANYNYIKHIVYMDSLPKFVQSQCWRHIPSDLVVKIFYALIVFIETLIFVFTFLGGIKMYRNVKKPALVFNQSKKTALIGITLSVFQWFFVFITIGGEWFLSYLSNSFNAKRAGEDFAILMLLALIFVSLKDD
ncbi:DUF2165 domain-containing protein [Aureivirga marina]|uniref:DUF2165 domain-containing protein n=1 Tax=Aureivirga marina TaxID=1182451 RepID=UPI001E5662EB|nr:DUF2165 domain-containing protein [Aureivirga marina]